MAALAAAAAAAAVATASSQGRLFFPPLFGEGRKHGLNPRVLAGKGFILEGGTPQARARASSFRYFIREVGCAKERIVAS